MRRVAQHVTKIILKKKFFSLSLSVNFKTGLDYMHHTSTSLKGLRLQFIVETWVALSHKELDLDFHLPLNFLAEVSTKPRTTATKYCLLRSSGKLYTA